MAFIVISAKGGFILSWLHTEGKYIVNEAGEKVFLRGVCFGGWLNMENFISGYPGSESSVREAIRSELGEERYEAFFRSFLDYFITESDLKFLKEMGATVVRVPFNYRHFEDDMKPGQFKESGFYYLDRVVEWGKKHGIYVILDLHAAPGWQSDGWHCDNSTGVATLWQHADFQNRVAELWKFIADHYKDEPWVAGYNVLNEPQAPSMDILNRCYRQWTEAIRKIDSRHLIFLEGNNFSVDFEGLDEPFADNLVYSSHNYMSVTHKARTYPGTVNGEYVDKKWVEEAFLRRNKWLLERDIPSWVGEFGALYDGGVDTPTPADRARLQALADQLDVFNQYNQHWTIWTYKDVDVQGLTVASKDSEYMRRIRPILDLKRDLGTDAWTARDSGPMAREITAIVERIAGRSGDWSFDTFRLRRQMVNRAVYGAMAAALSPLYADCFRDMTVADITAMHEEAFRLENCKRRQYLIDVMQKRLK